MDTTHDTDKSQTGHKLELGNATTKLVEALVTGNADLLREAAGDHATALNSQATAMAAAIAAPLYGRFDTVSDALLQLTAQIDRSDRARLDRNALFQEELNTRLDGHAHVLDEDVKRLAASVEGAAILAGKAYTLAGDAVAGVAKLAGVVNEQGEKIDSMDQRLITVETTPGTYPDLLAGMARLEKAVNDVSRQSDRRQLYLLIAIGLIVLLFIALIALQAARS
jgi:hypothetical protein